MVASIPRVLSELRDDIAIVDGRNNISYEEYTMLNGEISKINLKSIGFRESYKARQAFSWINCLTKDFHEG